MSLQVDGLYIMLFARATPDQCHWALYHHLQPTKGMKWHIRNISDRWMSDYNVTSSATKEFLLAGFLRIATIPPERAEEVNATLCGVPFTREDINCQSWVMDGIRLLMNAGIVKCASPTSLEKEATGFGYAQFDDTCLNVQPRPVVDSACCTLESD